jgi:hypothetical protein
LAGEKKQILADFWIDTDFRKPEDDEVKRYGLFMILKQKFDETLDEFTCPKSECRKISEE